MEYTLPIAGDFTAEAMVDEQANWDGFLHILTRRGRGRIGIGAALRFDGQVAGVFAGEFVALGQQRL
jgi:thioesterase domain-containing protein